MLTKSEPFLFNLAIDLFHSSEYDHIVDIQFKRILQRIESHICNKEIGIVMEWLHESIKNEIKLKKKLESYPFAFNKPVFKLLLTKSNTLHKTIIDLLIDLLENSMVSSQPELGDIFKLTHQIISELIDNINIDEEIYGNYIQLLSHTVENLEIQSQPF